MCGIVGVIPKAFNGFDKKTEDSFYQMLYVDALRGDDSTGVILVEKDTSFGIMKEAYSAAYSIDGIQYSKMGKSMYSQGKALIGHNRKKTSGAISDDNAHPFVVDDTFAMVHNGTLHNHKKLADTEVDSEALAIHLSKVLVKDFDKEAFEEAIGQVEGAYAIASYSQDADCVFITRNTQRPMAFVETKEGFFFASETLMLYWILARNGIDLKESQPEMIKENVLYKIDLNNNKLEKIEYTPKKATPVATHKATGKTVTHPMTFAGNQQAVDSSKEHKMSKNGFKVAKRHWLGKSFRFWADDYLEKHFPQTIAQGETDVIIMGEHEEFAYEHTIRGEFDLNELSPSDMSIIDCLYSGTVKDMTYDKRSGCVTFHMGLLDKVPQSIKVNQHEVQPALH